jgi:hypothetical protein
MESSHIGDTGAPNYVHFCTPLEILFFISTKYSAVFSNTPILSYFSGKVEVQTRTGHGGPEWTLGVAVVFHLGAKRGLVLNATPRATLPPEKTRYPLYRRLGESRGRSTRLRKISPPTGIRSQGRPARSESLYRLSYPGLRILSETRFNCHITAFPNCVP